MTHVTHEKDQATRYPVQTLTQGHTRLLTGQYRQKPQRLRAFRFRGSLSSLLGAIYLSPLDTAIEDLREHCDVDYIRYADDFIIMARTRFLLRRAITRMHQVLTDLRLQVHPDKRVIGRPERGCDFLGFVLHPHRHLEPSLVSIQRLCERARRLHEHGADHQRLRRYVHHWHLWFTSGLGHLADPRIHESRYWQLVIEHCGLDLPVHLPA